MAGNPTPADLDEAWLRLRLPDVAEDEVEVFVEHVGKLVNDDVHIETAWLQALAWLEAGREKLNKT